MVAHKKRDSEQFYSEWTDLNIALDDTLLMSDAVHLNLDLVNSAMIS